jgi:glycosyltransferase involved in cell wall biosynthesis
LAARMGARGRELVRQQFSEEHMVEQIENLYRRLAAEIRIPKSETRNKHP